MDEVVVGSYERPEHEIRTLVVRRGSKFWVEAHDTGDTWTTGPFDSAAEAWGYVDAWLKNSWGLSRTSLSRPS